MDIASFNWSILGYIALGLFILIWVSKCCVVIGPKEFAVVIKRWGRPLTGGNIIAMHGEAGYQPRLLRTGINFVFWPVCAIQRFPLVEIPNDCVGVIFAQVGLPLEIGQKTAIQPKDPNRKGEYFDDFSDVRKFLELGGQKGIQRYVLPPGMNLVIHPYGFVVKTYSKMYGKPLTEEVVQNLESIDDELFRTFEVPVSRKGDHTIGIVNIMDGPPIEDGNIACRIAGFGDVDTIEKQSLEPREGAVDPHETPSKVLNALVTGKNHLHSDYQNMQAFFDNGGKMGLQHDVLLPGKYNLNPFLVKVELASLPVVNQGEVAVVKSHIGLQPKDTSGTEFKHGAIVDAGHRGVWSYTLRTGVWRLNPMLYYLEKVPTQLIKLAWADRSSSAHDLDKQIGIIRGKTKDAYDNLVDLEVQIFINETDAPKAILSGGTMQNLINEIMNPIISNYFRNALQQMTAEDFIRNRKEVQEGAEKYIREQMISYYIDVKSVLIQDVVPPEAVANQLKAQNLAEQQKATFKLQQVTEEARIQVEKTKAQADNQKELATSEIAIKIAENVKTKTVTEAEAGALSKERMAKAEAEQTRQAGLAKAEITKATGVAEAEAFTAKGTAEATIIKAKGEATAEATEKVGSAEAKVIQAKGEATAEAYKKQTEAIGKDGLVTIAVAENITKIQKDLVPKVVVGGGSDKDGSGLAGVMAGMLGAKMVNSFTVEEPQSPPSETEKTVEVFPMPKVENPKDEKGK